jgi:hypothetical protein
MIIKKYFTTYFVHLIHKSMSDSTLTKQCHHLHLHSQYLHLPHTPNISILFTAISQLITINLIQCVEYTALLKTLHSHFW